jgi:hypothetical protein
VKPGEASPFQPAPWRGATIHVGVTSGYAVIQEQPLVARQAVA